MPTYRKVPIEVEAFELTSTCERPEWAKKVELVAAEDGIYVTHAFIDTLEGRMRADLGDFIVKGINNELYPVKPDIFAKTFELATEQREADTYDRPYENTPMPRDDTI